MYACEECGESSPGRARFCLGCGRPLRRATDEARKVVSVLFADVVGSTSIGERHDAEAYRQVLGRYFERMDAIVTRHGGTVEKYIGDAMMAVFGLPVVHEDDALRAVRAAVEIRDEVARLASEATGLALRWRIGVNTGEVLVGGSAGRTLATGDAVNVAARLEQAAGAGEVLIGPDTYGLVRDAVAVEPLAALELRGRSASVPAFRVLTVDPGASGHARSFDLPFVGREDERELLALVRRRALGGSSAQLVTVYGTVGVGKTRLVTHVFGDTGVRTLWGRCLPYGEGVTYWPFAEALAAASGIGVAAHDPADVVHQLDRLAGGRADAGDIEAVAVVTGLCEGAPPDDPAEALRRYLAALAGDDGLILVIDDLHLAEPLLLETLETVARSRHVPLVVVAVARPELLEGAPRWGSGITNSVALLLDPLDPRDTSTLVRDRLDGPVDQGLVDQLTRSADGNPLFLEELIAMLLEDGTLLVDGDGRWRRSDPHHELTLPASIHAVLAARVDALDPADRAVLGRAAVCGQRFAVEAVQALDDEEQDAAGRLATLVERELLQPMPDGYAFRHGFVRDAVYAGLTRRTRSRWHEQHARWLEDQPPGPQVDEFVAYHLERALEERGALDPDDPTLATLTAHAGDRLSEAGQRAFERGDMHAAVRLLDRARDLVPGGHEGRPGMLVTLGRAMAEVGDFVAADATLREALSVAHDGDRGFRAHTRITHLWVRSNIDLDGWVDAARAAADDAEEVFQSTGDDRGLGRVWGLRAEVAYLRARYADAEAAMRRAEALARDAGDVTEERENALGAAFILLAGPRPNAEVEAACHDLLARYPGERSVEARALQILAGVAAMSGDGQRARRTLAEAIERLSELGQAYWLAMAAVSEGQLEALVGDRSAAEAAWQRGLEALERMGDRSQAALVAALLSASVAGDDPDRARTLLADARAEAAREDLEAQVRLQLADARLAAARGRLDDGIEAATAAVAAAGDSDGATLRADAELALAELLVAAGRHADATAIARRASERYASKGHVVGAERARAVAAVTPSTAPGGAPP